MTDADRPSDVSSDVVGDILGDIESSPTPYHAATHAAGLLVGAGFRRVDATDAFPTAPGRYLLLRGGALVAWITPPRVETHPGFCVVGAHTDSPNLRVRANPEVTSAGWSQVGVEVYGGALTNSWLDRDLALAGRVVVADADGVTSERLVSDPEPILRIPQLAIHLDRDVREKGLLLDPQRHLTPLWATGSTGPGVQAHVARLAGVEPDALLAWELMLYDVQPPAIVGRDRDLFASARIDNQVSCFAGIRALIDRAESSERIDARIPVLALYDHEEVGSASSTGAAGGFLAAILERISASMGADRIEHLRSLAASVVVSADGAHATHPNYADRHEPNHQIAVNGGVVVKRNANQRYATDATTEGWFRSVCRQADLRVQTYIHRNDLPCGSTIGPLTAAELAVPTIDIGAPQLAMHSIRELAGVNDLRDLVTALRASWS